MTTTKMRVNVSLSSSEEDYLKMLAKRDEMPIASKARELIRIAMELEEDYHLCKLTRERDIMGAKYISHNQFLKRVSKTPKSCVYVQD